MNKGFHSLLRTSSLLAIVICLGSFFDYIIDASRHDGDFIDRHIDSTMQEGSITPSAPLKHSDCLDLGRHGPYEGGDNFVSQWPQTPPDAAYNSNDQALHPSAIAKPHMTTCHTVVELERQVEKAKRPFGVLREIGFCLSIALTQLLGVCTANANMSRTEQNRNISSPAFPPYCPRCRRNSMIQGW